MDSPRPIVSSHPALSKGKFQSRWKDWQTVIEVRGDMRSLNSLTILARRLPGSLSLTTVTKKRRWTTSKVPRISSGNAVKASCTWRLTLQGSHSTGGYSAGDTSKAWISAEAGSRFERSMAQMLQVGFLIERRSFYGEVSNGWDGMGWDGWMNDTMFRSQYQPHGVDLPGGEWKGGSDNRSLLGRASAGN